MRKQVVGALSAVVVLAAGTAVVGAARRGDEPRSRAGITTRNIPLSGGRSVDVSLDDLRPETLDLVTTTDRAAYLTAMSSEGMDCFIVRLIDDPDGEGRVCDLEKGLAERGSQTLTVVQRDGARIGGIRSYRPVAAATRDGRTLPVSDRIVPYVLGAGESATIEMTTSDAKVLKTVP